MVFLPAAALSEQMHFCSVALVAKAPKLVAVVCVKMGMTAMRKREPVTTVIRACRHWHWHHLANVQPHPKSMMS